ncbi:MAG: fibronectin type III domain-containing protein, partial [Thermodesulfobacteriota bacterium]|nr:fibronectin type III domain-containing protein [Thermodesulfobacteriota bacterium]
MKVFKNYLTSCIPFKSIREWIYSPITIFILCFLSISPFWNCGVNSELTPPLPPTDLTAEAVSSSLVTLSWKDNSINEFGFKIEKKLPGAEYSEIDTVSFDVTFYDDIGAIVGETYYRIRAFNHMGFSLYSNEAVVYPVEDCTESDLLWQNYSLEESFDGCFTVDFVGKPNNNNMDGIFALSDGEGTGFSDYAVLVRFNETGIIDARNGDIYEADEDVPYTAGVSYHFHLAVDVPNHTYSVSVTPTGSSEQTIATDYAFRTEHSDVTKLDNWGLWADAGYSFQVCNVVVENTTPEPTEPPEAPSNPQATPISSSQIDISWTDNSDNEIGFTIERAPDDNGSPGYFEDIISVSANTESYPNIGLPPDTTFYYRVKAYNSAGISDCTDIVSATTHEEPIIPEADFHVNQNHPQASDTNPGTEDLPFLTISAALSQATAGDTVLVRAGTYRESITLPSGDAGNQFTLMGTPGERVIISGKETVSGWTIYSGDIWVATLDWEPINLYVGYN